MECYERLSNVIVFLMLIVLGSTGIIQPSQKSPDYQYSKQVSQEKCPPGEYEAYQSRNQTKNCVPCKDGTYTAEENNVKECRKCYGPCMGGSVETVPCSARTNRKCECAPHYYCAAQHATKCENCERCDATKGPHKSDEENYSQACRPCPSGTFLNTSYSQRCQPHTNCTALKMTIRVKGNSTADNDCHSAINSSQLETLQKITSSFTSYMMWIIAILCILCVIVMLRSSQCKTSNNQEIGTLVKLRFICICDTENAHGKGGDNEEEIKLKTLPETGEPVDGSITDSKPTTLIVPISTNEAEAPRLEDRPEMLDIETVSGVGSREDNIPFPVQENGRNSNTYYPIEEQNKKQYYQPVMTEAKSGIQARPYLHSSS